MGVLLRLAVWGGCALIATGAAMLAGRSEVGSARAGAALAAFRASPLEFFSHPAALAAQPSEADKQAKQLAEAVQTLTADRDRLAARIATLERSLNDLTGAIAQDRSAAATAAKSGNPPAPSSGETPDASATPGAAPAATALPVAPPESASASEETRPAETPPVPIATIGTVVNIPVPRPGPLSGIQSYVSAASASHPTARLAAAPAGPDATASVAPAPKITAVELAIATNINALRARWGALRTAQPTLLDGLKPLVSSRASARPGFTEFHLVAGPVADADSAARLCAALSTARIPCRPAVYNGQSLDLR